MWRIPTQKKLQICVPFILICFLCFLITIATALLTLGYALAYHARELYKKYKIGYGILTMQGKESKHSAIKQELKSCTNRSKSEGPNNKWHQIMRSSYVRNFYLLYCYPINMYCSHYDSRNPKVGIQQTCICYRQLKPESELCDSCTTAEEFI